MARGGAGEHPGPGASPGHGGGIRPVFAGLAPDRREFLRGGALTLLAVALGPRAVFAADAGPGAERFPSAGPRRLRMLNTHTLERVDVTYHDGAGYVPGALAEVDRLLRDHRCGEVHPIDTATLDIAWSLACSVGKPPGEYEIISGYRSRRTNELLYREGRGVALHSLHCQGRAIDLRLPGVASSTLRDAALALARGGVGYYRGPDFVHVDSGRVRRW